MLLILPHQLFAKKYIKHRHVVIWEHPHYFTKYKYNKKKIMLHRGSMKYYYDYLKKHDVNVSYYNYDDKLELTDYCVFDPIDNIKLPGKYEMLESPNFLLNKEIYTKYRNKTDKFFFNAFYMFGKKEIGVIPAVKSQDKHNRKKLPKDIEIPPLPKNPDRKYINIGTKYAKKFDTYGNCDKFIYPLTHKTARVFLRNFVKNKLKHFGDYQDAISEDNYLFHSVLSSSINIGLLNPLEVIAALDCVAMNSYEGFIRQLFWREYQRYCHIYFDFKGNYFGNKRKLSAKWYSGELGVEPVDKCIKDGFNTGYLHHINRLMVVGNYMNLSGIAPKEGFRWFMEFSCDSYEWVMKQNVYEMVFYISGGKTMRRPYISSSNYIIKMSHYKRSQCADWCEKWDKLYHKFVAKHKKKIKVLLTNSKDLNKFRIL